jgi:hypothetical protein
MVTSVSRKCSIRVSRTEHPIPVAGVIILMMKIKSVRRSEE